MKKATFIGITVWRGTFPFRLTFSHNLATRTEAETLLVRIGTGQNGAGQNETGQSEAGRREAGQGASGYGQALPRSYLTGESMDGAEQSIHNRWWPAFRERGIPTGTAPLSLNDIIDHYTDIHAAAGAARENAAFAAIDIAATAAVVNSQSVIMPEWPGPKPLVGVITAGGARKAYWLARVLYLLGYRWFKIKVGRDENADRTRLEAVKKAVGTGCRLFADANASWDLPTAERRLAELARYGIGVVEEPLTAGAAAGADWRGLERATGVQLMADESLVTIEDARRLVASPGGGPSYWNVRLAKNGGFTGVSAMARLARENGVRVYAGILVGESGALAAAGRLAAYLTGAECLEYGFSRIFLRNDPFRGSPAGYRGTVAPPGRDGGVALRMNEQALLKNFRPSEA